MSRLTDQKSPKYAKNAEGLARAFFPDLLKQPRKLQQALKKFVLPWMQAESFPKRTQHGFVIAECLKWRKDEEARNQKLEVRSLAASATPELPVQNAGANLPAGATGFLTPQQALEGRLDLLQDMYLRPEAYERKIAQWEVKELREHRPQLWKKVAAPPATGETADETSPPPPPEPFPREAHRPEGATLPDAESQVVLARLLARHFSGRVKIDISEQQISNWKQGLHLPAGAPLPPTKLGNRHDTQAWADWIERWILPIYGNAAAPQGEFDAGVFDVFQQAQRAVAQKQIEDARRAKAEADDAVRRLSDKWIATDQAVLLAAGALRQLGDYWRTRNERTMIEDFYGQMLAAGVVLETANRLKDVLVQLHQRFTDDVENRVAAAARRYEQTVKAEAEARTLPGGS